jgi:DegV family protein with EDD domain
MFDEILVLLPTLPTMQVGNILPLARAAASNARNRDSILIIDTQTVSIGLGMLVQAAAGYIEKGLSLQEMKTSLLGLMEHVYCILCLDGLTYLSHSGFIAPSQALIGEMLGVRPLYMLEKGSLVPIQKVRNARHLVECLYEFIGEFAGVDHIAIVQGVPAYEPEARALRDRIAEDLPDTPISEHIISPALAAVFGPHTIGIFVREPNEFDEVFVGGN